MLFNSLQFAVFFIVFYVIYIFLRNKAQNRFLLLASYIFYGFWDYRFIVLILVTTVNDHFCSLKIHASNSLRRKRMWLFLSLLINLSILGFFKYFNFFASNLAELLNIFGIKTSYTLLNIILPVGISFYTFKSISYTVDVYRGNLVPTRCFLDYALYVAYLPQLLAGPIERAGRLLKQIETPRKITSESFSKGAYLIFWGLFQKIFIADNLAKIVDRIFSAPPPYEGALILLGAYAFAFQILCDFSGYSDIARGLGSLMGFDTMLNFDAPYFSADPSEFWRRWHISLSNWLRDYLFLPISYWAYRRLPGDRFLGVSSTGIAYSIGIAATMLLGGLWHGAGWTFILWGAYHGLLLIIYRILKGIRFKRPKGTVLKTVWHYAKIVIFFHLICLGWLLFRAGSIDQILGMVKALFSNFNVIHGLALKGISFKIATYIWFFVITEYLVYRFKDDLIIFRLPTWTRVLIYIFIYICLVTMGVQGGREFIYFQF